MRFDYRVHQEMTQAARIRKAEVEAWWKAREEEEARRLKRAAVAEAAWVALWGAISVGALVLLALPLLGR